RRLRSIHPTDGRRGISRSRHAGMRRAFSRSPGDPLSYRHFLTHAFARSDGSAKAWCTPGASADAGEVSQAAWCARVLCASPFHAHGSQDTLSLELPADWLLLPGPLSRYVASVCAMTRTE